MTRHSGHLTSTSKFLSLVLRHQPEVIGMQLDSEGWLSIDELIQNSKKYGRNLTLDLLHEVVAACEKKRFALSDDGLRIRASQGHSIPDVELKLESVAPPDLLYHGTVAAFVESIRENGLQKRSRNHVHLSVDIETATKVAARRGKPVILHISALKMHLSGFAFYMSANGVWLTDSVPASFIEFHNATKQGLQSMLDDDNADDNKAELELARKRGMVRWCWAIVVSALVTAAVCGLTPVRFASSEQLLLSLFVIFATWLVLKVLASRGKFRFASLLGLMAFTAFLCIYILAPLRDRTEQNAALELLRSRGGVVEFSRITDKYPTAPMGWVPGRSGIPYPAALHYFEQKYLYPAPVSRLVIPASLFRKNFLSSLHVENLQRPRVLLDGKGDFQEFNSSIRDFTDALVLSEENGYRAFYFQMEKLQPEDITFLNGVQVSASGGDLPTIRVVPSDQEIQVELLDNLENGFEIYLDYYDSVASPLLQQVMKSKSLKRIVCFNPDLTRLSAAIGIWNEPLESLQLPYCQFTSADWQRLCNQGNVRSLLLNRCFRDGKPLSKEDIGKLSVMRPLEELKIGLEDSNKSCVLQVFKLEQLKRLLIYGTVEWNDNLKEAVQSSNLETLSITVQEKKIAHEPWMDRFRSLRINNVEYSYRSESN